MAGIKLSITKDSENLLEIMDCLGQIKRLATQVNNSVLADDSSIPSGNHYCEWRALNSRNVDKI